MATGSGFRDQRVLIVATPPPLLAAVFPWDQGGDAEEQSRDSWTAVQGALEAAGSSTVVAEEIHTKEHLHFASETAPPWRPEAERPFGAIPLPTAAMDVVAMVGGAATMTASVLGTFFFFLVLGLCP
ncbi:hypothetical protein PIB30_064122 [Stylosanthes scabra]|uniref:Uncharacterized protein n=1 Tax=Stylosanthes scabra TaxID=79078 RepID=A0ABU6VLT6_9FABA|nr:hypothetical protein [Stylosanthes scabra]